MSLHNRNYDIIHHHHNQDEEISSVIVDVEDGIKIEENKRNTFCQNPSNRSSLGGVNVFKSNQLTNDSSNANFFGQGSHINSSAFGFDIEH